jgi:hypothetical protein
MACDWCRWRGACARRGWSAADRLAVVRHSVATFLLKKNVHRAGRASAPSRTSSFRGALHAVQRGRHKPLVDTPQRRNLQDVVEGAATGDYALITAADREQFYASIRPTSADDRRPAFFSHHEDPESVRRRVWSEMLFGAVSAR